MFKKVLSISFVVGALALLFQNCADDDLYSTSTRGASSTKTVSELGSTNGDSGWGSGSGCMLRNVTVPDGTSITAYATANVPAGQSCQSQQRTCSSGVLSGTYMELSCTAGTNNSAPCQFHGQSVASGFGVTAFESATVPAGQQCISQSRVCTNGTLSGTFTFASCSPTSDDSTATMADIPNPRVTYTSAGVTFRNAAAIFFDKNLGDSYCQGYRQGWLADMSNSVATVATLNVCMTSIGSGPVTNLGCSWPTTGATANTAVFGTIRCRVPTPGLTEPFYSDKIMAGKRLTLLTYVVLLNRAANTTEMNYWSELMSPLNRTPACGLLARGVALSPEFTSRRLPNGEFVSLLYHSLLGRVQDQDGFARHLEALDNGTATREQIVDNFITSTEFTNVCASRLP
jgi:hypothetical protein